MSKSASLQVAVVGHTNVGKTSLIRTLTRNANFGEVDASPGTTRHVESQIFMVDDREVLRLMDTPGFEDSIALLELLEQQRPSSQELGIDKLFAFLGSPHAQERFAQEAKVIRQLLDCDLMLYVIDAREPVLGKYRDELSILSMAAKPVFPLLNFVANHKNHEAEWRQMLAKLNLHAVVNFDSVVYDFTGELLLYKKIQAMMEEWHEPLQRLIDHRMQAWKSLFHTAANHIATLLIEVAAYRLPIHDGDQTQETTATLQATIRKQEQQSAIEILNLFQFRSDDYGADALPVTSGKWEMDLFDAETMKTFGVEASSAAAKGAAIGLGVDLAVGGTSLGAAAAIGAVIGGLWQVGNQFGDDLLDFLKDDQYLNADDTTLQLIWLRSTALVDALRNRGHAAQGIIARREKIPDESNAEILEAVQIARNHPDWAATQSSATSDSQKPRQIKMLGDKILQTWQSSPVQA